MYLILCLIFYTYMLPNYKIKCICGRKERMKYNFHIKVELKGIRQP